MRGIFLIIFGLLISSSVLAQNPENEAVLEELDQEIDELYSEVGQPVQPKVVLRPVQKVQTQQVQTAPVVVAQPVQAPAPTYVQQRPVTVIQDNPLKESRADLMRKKRIAAEEATEQKIVEKLEQERMNAEQKRADKLINAFNGTPAEVEAPVQVNPLSVTEYPPMNAVQTVPAVPVQTVAPTQELVEEIVTEEAKPVQEDIVFYIGGGAGVTDYVGTSNIRDGFSGGLVGGAIMSDGLILEGSVLFSNYEIDEINPYTYVPTLVAMDQLDASIGVKYHLTQSRVRPLVGAQASYIRRNYEPLNFASMQTASSNAFDVALLGGVDVQLGKKFIIGAQVSYNFNLTYSTNPTVYNPFFFGPTNTNGLDPVEEVSRYSFIVSGRFLF